MIIETTLGIDIGGTQTKIGIVDITGRVLAHTAFSSQAEKHFDVFLSTLALQIDTLKEQIEEPFILRGAGVGAPNANYYSGQMENPINFNWGYTVPIVASLKDLLQIPAVMTNDANAAAVGEMRFGSGKGMKNFVLITLGTGLGSALVVDGKLVHGKHGLAGEMGHIIVKADGRKCNCGNQGCLETYASATGIKRTVFKLMADMNSTSPLRKIPYSEMTAKMITEAALTGNELAQHAFEYTGQILGRKLADTVAYLDPEAIILSGGLTKAGDLLLEPTREYMDLHTFPILRGKTDLLISKLTGANTAVLGAAALAWDHLEQLEKENVAVLH